MFIQKKPRRMASFLPVLPVRIRPDIKTQEDPKPPGIKAICWACGVIEAAWVGALVWLVARMV